MKKPWAPVWSGLVFDPSAKHFQKIGNAIWALLYFINLADSRNGSFYFSFETLLLETGWKKRSAERWFSILQTEGYISAWRHQTGFMVKIEKWQSIKKKTAKTIGAEIKKNIGQQTLQFPAEMDQNTPPKMAGGSAKNGGQFTKFGGQSRQKWRAAPPKMAGNLQNLAEVPQLTRQDSISCEPLKGLKGGERKHKGGEGGKTSPPPPLFNPEAEKENFYTYAKRAHQNFFGVGLVVSGNDRINAKVQLIFEHGADRQTLRMAYWIFLRSTDSYLKNKPRNLPVFSGQIENCLVAAKSAIRQSQAQVERKREGKKREMEHLRTACEYYLARLEENPNDIDSAYNALIEDNKAQKKFGCRILPLEKRAEIERMLIPESMNR